MQQLLAGLAAGVEGARDLHAAEGAVVEQAAVLAGERHALGDALVDDVDADLGQPVDVGLARAVVAALDGVVEEPVDRVAVALVVLGRVDAALGGDRVRAARGVLVAEGLHDVARLAQRRGGARRRPGRCRPRSPRAGGGWPGWRCGPRTGGCSSARRSGRRVPWCRRSGRRACSSRRRRRRTPPAPTGTTGARRGGVGHVGHGCVLHFSMTPARTKIGTRLKPPAMITASRERDLLGQPRATAAWLVQPRVWAALQMPWCRWAPSIAIATR